MDETFQVTLTLPVRLINVALVALSKLPLEQSVEAWNTIKVQTQAAIDAAQKPPEPPAA